MTLTGVRNGGVYLIGRSPFPSCHTTDAVSGVRFDAVAAITGGRPDFTGVLTVTCENAQDEAGNKSPPFSEHWTNVYAFGGFIAPHIGSTLSHTAKTITVKAFLADTLGNAIASATQADLAAHHQVRVTLTGPGIAAVTVTCSWHATGAYLRCLIPTPRTVKTGRTHKYLITMAENLGSGWIRVPADAASENPGPVYFT